MLKLEVTPIGDTTADTTETTQRHGATLQHRNTGYNDSATHARGAA